MAETQSEFSEDPLDRLAARSLAAAERSARPVPAPAKRSLLPWIITTGAVAFSIGMIANPWFEANVRTKLPVQLQRNGPLEGSAQMQELEGRVRALEASKEAGIKGLAQPVDTISLGLAARIAAVEAASQKLANEDANVGSRVDRLASDLAANADASVSGQVAVRELLLLSAARRLVETGKPLGILEAPVVQSLGLRDRSATDALVAWSKAPIDREGLQDRLEEPVAAPVAPPVVGGSWWDRLLGRLSGVVQVREADTPGAAMEVREAAVAALKSGDLTRAIAAMELAQVSEVRDRWLADAQRLLAAEDALDRLETLLLATPSGLVNPILPATSGQSTAAAIPLPEVASTR